jgi:hypothetical protein
MIATYFLFSRLGLPGRQYGSQIFHPYPLARFLVPKNMMYTYQCRLLAAMYDFYDQNVKSCESTLN